MNGLYGPKDNPCPPSFLSIQVWCPPAGGDHELKARQRMLKKFADVGQQTREAGNEAMMLEAWESSLNMTMAEVAILVDPTMRGAMEMISNEDSFCLFWVL